MAVSVVAACAAPAPEKPTAPEHASCMASLPDGWRTAFDDGARTVAPGDDRVAMETQQVLVVPHVVAVLARAAAVVRGSIVVAVRSHFTSSVTPPTHSHDTRSAMPRAAAALSTAAARR